MYDYLCSGGRYVRQADTCCQSTAKAIFLCRVSLAGLLRRDQLTDQFINGELLFLYLLISDVFFFNVLTDISQLELSP